jgi:tetratricopeptide (TPR) repeat protein
VLLDKGDAAAAFEHFERANRGTPDPAARDRFVRALNNLGVALGSQGKLDDAIQQFKRALALDPDFAQARHNLTTALQARGR